MTETRTQALARWEADGMLDPSCKSCQEWFYAVDRLPQDVHAPRHKASRNCESGGRPHCTCDGACW